MIWHLITSSGMQDTYVVHTHLQSPFWSGEQSRCHACDLIQILRNQKSTHQCTRGWQGLGGLQPGWRTIASAKEYAGVMGITTSTWVLNTRVYDRRAQEEPCTCCRLVLAELCAQPHLVAVISECDWPDLSIRVTFAQVARVYGETWKEMMTDAPQRPPCCKVSRE